MYSALLGLCEETLCAKRRRERGTREGAREDGDGYAHPNIRVSRNTKVVVMVEL